MRNRWPAKGLQAEVAWGDGPGLGKQVSAGVKRVSSALSPPSSVFTLSVLVQGTSDSLIAEGWILGKPCRVTIARPDSSRKAWKEAKPVVRLANGVRRDHPRGEGGCGPASLGRRAFRIWMFVAEVTDAFNLGLDVVRACDASVDLGRHVLRLGQKEVTLWNPGARPT
jgi:hypothetical protein